MFRVLRIIVLLFILISLALGAWREKTRSVEWKSTLPVTIYPINGDGSAVTDAHVRSLRVADFKPIETFMRDEAVRHGRSTSASIEILLGAKIDKLPPSPPSHGSPLEIIVWSLKMRWWTYRNAPSVGPGNHVKMFVLYFDPAQSARLDHSTGLQKGLIGRVNTFATRDMAMQNNVIIAHEILHTLGASDKYDVANNQPVFPDGYAEPDLNPLLPQRFAEIMAGRTPISGTAAETPVDLQNALIGSKTALEINWK